MERGNRAKIKLYDDSDFFDNGFTSYLSYQDEEIGEFNPDAFSKDPITDEEINELFGINENSGDASRENYDINELIQYWRDNLPDIVDYAEMVGAPASAYGCKYVYEDPDGYFIEDTIRALVELKELKEIVNDAIKQLEENNNKIKEMIVMTSGETNEDYIFRC